MQAPTMADAAPTRSSSVKHIVLVHGACHGGWCWYKVAARLRSSPSLVAAGIRVLTPDLAASGIDERQLREVPTFRDYTAPLLDLLRPLPDGEKAILVGHSLGGINIALAAEEHPDRVAAAVFLCAFMPDCTSPPSRVLLKNAQGNRALQLDNETKPQDEDGKLPASFMFGPQYIEQNVYQLCSNEDKTLTISLMRVGSAFLEHLQIEKPLSKEQYGSTRKIYIVAKQDRTISEGVKRWMVLNNPVEEVKEIEGADHMAMLSKPNEVAQCIMDIAEKYI